MFIKLKIIFTILVFSLNFNVYSEDEAGLQTLSGFSETLTDFVESTNNFLKDRFYIGTRITHFDLETEKDDYIGSVDTLDSRQNYDPTRLFIDILIKSFEKVNLEFEITWDRLAMNTITSSDGHNDGTLEMSGPIFALQGRFPNDTKFTPYAGIGAVWFNRTHVAKGWWHYGFKYDTDPADADRLYVAWRESGSPSWPNGGYTRTFELDETWGWVVTLGCSIQIIERLEADLYFRYMNATVDNTFTLAFYDNVHRVTESEFDVSNFAYGIGLRYKY